MRRPSWVSSEVDLTRPSAARVYDFYLGGSHNLEVDRRMAREAISLWPDLPMIMQSNRAFLRRAVRYLAAQGISQFLDIGSGIPTEGHLRQAARKAHPPGRGGCADDGPAAGARRRAVLPGGGPPAVLRRPARAPGPPPGGP